MTELLAVETALTEGPPPPAEPPSPFLPGTNIQYAWDSTSLSYFKQCPRLYQYKMIEGWRKEEENVHLRFGIELHRSLQDYDLSLAAGIPHDDAVHDVVRELLIRTYEWRSDNKYKNRDSLVRTVIWYLDYYAEDPAETFMMQGEPRCINGHDRCYEGPSDNCPYCAKDTKPAVEVSFRFELEWGPSTVLEGTWEQTQPYLLCGHLDRVVSFQDSLFVMDHKTTTKTPSDWYFKQFEPNNQMTLYTLAGQVIFDAPIKGVIIDSCQVLIEGSRFVRSFTYRTKDQVDEWLGDLQVLLAKAEEYATAGYWPMNDTACVMCEFREICSKSPGVREKFLQSEFVRKPWNPLEPR